VRRLLFLVPLVLVAGCGSSGPKHTVALSVTAKEAGSVGEISYEIGSGGSVQKVTDADIPWTLTVDDTPNGVGKLSLTVATAPNPDTVATPATFTCTVTLDGKVVVTKTALNSVACTK
jgi:hypothetical protein